MGAAGHIRIDPTHKARASAGYMVWDCCGRAAGVLFAHVAVVCAIGIAACGRFPAQFSLCICGEGVGRAMLAGHVACAFII